MKPEIPEAQSDYQKKLTAINIELADLEVKISECTDKLILINITIDELQQLIAKCDLLEADVEELNKMVSEFKNNHPNDILTKTASLSSPKDQLLEYLRVLKETKQNEQQLLGKENGDTGFWAKLNSVKEEKAKLVATADSEEKKYQKYLEDTKEWETERNRIIGSATEEGSLEYFKQEREYIEKHLQDEYKEARADRDLKVRELFVLKQSIVDLYREIYAPVESEIKMLLGELDESIEFSAELQLTQMNLSEALLSYISQKHAGIFRGRVEAYNKMMQFVRETEFNNTALRMKEFYPEWAENTAYAVGYKVQRNGKLWRAVQAHTSQMGWEPENAASLWEQVNETHAGTLEDPIPYDGNMTLENGKYYTQDYEVYLCIRDTGNPVYNALSELVGIYMEEITWA